MDHGQTLWGSMENRIWAIKYNNLHLELNSSTPAKKSAKEPRSVRPRRADPEGYSKALNVN